MNINYSSLYDKRVMKKGKKRHWGFTCPHCKNKYSSKTHTEYFIIGVHEIGQVTDNINFNWNDKLFCSSDCLFKFLNTNEIDLDKTVNDLIKLEKQRDKAFQWLNE